MPCGVSIEVGSSRMRTREPFQRALMISTCCCWPSARLARARVGVDRDAERVRTARRAAPARPPRPGRGLRVGPEHEVLEHACSVGIEGRGAGRPCRCRARPPGARRVDARPRVPSTRIVPASGWYSPDRMLISVDLPAPFSPSRQRTSPGMARRLMWSFATTPGKALVMPTSSTAGDAARGRSSPDRLGPRHGARGRAARPSGGPGPTRSTGRRAARLTSPASASSGTSMLPSAMPAAAASTAVQASAEMFGGLEQQMPPLATFERVALRRRTCPRAMSASACVRCRLKSHRTDDSRTPWSSMRRSCRR